MVAIEEEFRPKAKKENAGSFGKFGKVARR
jgi:hypothetical protein